MVEECIIVVRQLVCALPPSITRPRAEFTPKKIMRRHDFVDAIQKACSRFPRIIAKLLFDNLQYGAKILSKPGVIPSNFLDKVYNSPNRTFKQEIESISSISFQYPTLQKLMGGAFLSANTLTSADSVDMQLFQESSKKPDRIQVILHGDPQLRDESLSLREAILQVITKRRWSSLVSVHSTTCDKIALTDSKIRFKTYFGFVFRGAIHLYKDYKWFLNTRQQFSNVQLPIHMVSLKHVPRVSLVIGLSGSVALMDPILSISESAYPFLIAHQARNQAYYCESSTHAAARRWCQSVNYISATTYVDIALSAPQGSQSAFFLADLGQGKEHNLKRANLMSKLSSIESRSIALADSIESIQSSVEMLRRLIPLSWIHVSKYHKTIKELLRQLKNARIRYEQLESFKHIYQILLSEEVPLSKATQIVRVHRNLTGQIKKSLPFIQLDTVKPLPEKSILEGNDDVNATIEILQVEFA